MIQLHEICKHLTEEYVTKQLTEWFDEEVTYTGHKVIAVKFKSI